MSREHLIRRYRQWYAILLRLYPTAHQERFGSGMTQTFADLLRERAQARRGVFTSALPLFVETFTALIKQNIMQLSLQPKVLVRIVLATASLLLVPWVAMRFTDEVNWTAFDFVAAAVLLVGSGLAYELAARTAGTMIQRAAVGLAVATALLLIWINLAVGIIGGENNRANLMYVGVLAVGFIGSLLARLQPRGMAWAMAATALAHSLVAVITLVAGLTTGDGLIRTLLGNVLFIAMWSVSALLFRREDGAARNV